MEKVKLRLALLAPLLAACVAEAPLQHSPCPCPAALGYTCCGTGASASCVRLGAGETCSSISSATPGADGGTDSDGDMNTPADGPLPPVTNPFMSVAIGSAHACGVRSDGTITCKGSNDSGQATPPPGVLFHQVVAGSRHTCGQVFDKTDRTKDKMWVCWGDNRAGQATAPAKQLYNVSAGERHTCGVSVDGIECWGDNSLGQTTPPTTINPPTNFSPVAAGRNHTCVVASSPDPAVPTMTRSRVVCWGDNSFGQSTPPDRVPATGSDGFLASGGDHSCAADFGGNIVCWGANDQGQSMPTPPGAIRNLSIASGHSCGTSFDPPLAPTFSLVCWGNGWGDATSVPAPGLFGWVVAGDYLNCALPMDTEQPLLCWGQTYEAWY